MSQLEPPKPTSLPTTKKSEKKPFYKRTWFIVLTVFFIIGAVGSNFDSSKTSPKKSVSTTDATSSNNSVVPSTSAESTETVSESNARKSAESYLKYQAFSRKGLITQLEFEGFSNQDATYGTDSLNADWNEQAAKSAASYLEYQAFSRKGLITQLEFEGFTSAQAEYGVSTTGL